MVKVRLTVQEVEDVRIATLRHMERGRMQIDALSRITGVKYITLAKFLTGERRSPSTAAILVARLPLGMVYREPGIVHVN